MDQLSVEDVRPVIGSFVVNAMGTPSQATGTQTVTIPATSNLPAQVGQLRPQLYASVTKTFRFEAAHFLPYHKGKCHRMHGHNYKVRVTCSGPLIPDGSQAGMVIDFEYLNGKNLDHTLLNDTLDNPTAENLAFYFLNHYQTLRAGCAWEVTVWETDDCSATVFI